MKRYVEKSLSRIPVEQAHGGSGARQVIFSRDDGLSPNLEAVTKGFLEPGGQFDWHDHEVDEFFIVTSGHGFVNHHDIEDQIQTTSYAPGDIFYCEAGVKHRIECSKDGASEYFFVRLTG